VAVLILWCTVVTVPLYDGSTMAVLCSICGGTLVYILRSLFGATVVQLWWICDRRATVEVLLSLWEYGGGSMY
jgi:hypothetical protein